MSIQIQTALGDFLIFHSLPHRSHNKEARRPRWSASQMNFIDPKPLYHKYRPFIRKRQLHKLLLVTLLRWLLSAAIVGAMYGVLASYSNRETLRKHRQIQFNALIVALSIALSLNLASSLKAMAGQLRWWALSLREWPIAEVRETLDRRAHCMLY